MRPLISGLALLLACAHGGGAVRVTGSVLYRERIALPQDALVRVTLADVSLIDVPERVIAEQEIRSEGRQVPIPFVLEVPAGAIDEARSYAVRAQILDASGQLLWSSRERHAVLTRGAPSELRILLRRVAPAGGPGARTQRGSGHVLD